MRDGGVHSLWFLSSEQYQSFVLKNSTVFTIKVTNNLKFPGWRTKAEIESISHDTNSNN